MGYMMLIVEPRGQREARTSEEGQAVWDRMVRFADGLKARGLLKMAESLRRDEEGARIQVRGGKSTLVGALMGLFDIVGTTASGWLTDRYSARHLLFAYYSLRGLSLLFLPTTLVAGGANLGVFAVLYGLDWIATVPPTVKLTTEAFGRQNTGVIYGWIGASHQLGASLAAFGAGAIRSNFGDYRLAFWLAALLCVGAGLSFLTIGRRTFNAQPVPRGLDPTRVTAPA